MEANVTNKMTGGIVKKTVCVRGLFLGQPGIVKNESLLFAHHWSRAALSNCSENLGVCCVGQCQWLHLGFGSVMTT